jgi:putative SOS response-associated peptidase YedK
MCGRYTLHTERDALARRFALDPPELAELRPRYNIAPTQPVWTVLEERGRPRALQMRWGLVPPWTRPGQPVPLRINARAESLAARPTYRESFQQRRCWILATGFYEWPRREGPRRGASTPYWIARRDGQPFAMAGLWSETSTGPGAPPLRSCAIVTTAASPSIGAIHDRMPAILPPQRERDWLSHALDGRLAELAQLLAPFDGGQLVVVPVSGAVNSVERDGPELIERSEPPQLSLL